MIAAQTLGVKLENIRVMPTSTGQSAEHLGDGGECGHGLERRGGEECA